jgi:hypothetical protein
MERANNGEPVRRYCGPSGKLVSWAELNPTKAKNKQKKGARRIDASEHFRR